MKSNKLTLMAAGAMLLLAYCSKSPVPEQPPETRSSAKTGATVFDTPCYKNPVIEEDGGDPFCFKYNGTYYMYRPEPSLMKVVVNTSADLVHWSATFDMTFSPGTQIWAPEVHLIGSDLYLYYAVPGGADVDGRDIRVCKLISPTSSGTNTPATVIGGTSTDINIDPTVFKNNSNYYLVWKSRPSGTSASALKIRQLSATNPATFIGSASVLLAATDGPVNKEHPDLLRQDYDNNTKSRYFLFFDSGQGDQASYKVEYATAGSMLGPYTLKGVLRQQNPAKGIYGVGGQSVVRDGDNYRWLVYRAKQTSGASWSDRRPCIDRLFVDATANTATATPTRKPDQSPYCPVP